MGIREYKEKIMPLTKRKKDDVIKKFRTHRQDTGSPEVQIAILSAEINELTSHLKKHKKDHSSRRGLLRKVGQRRRLMRYLNKENIENYAALIKKLRLKDTIGMGQAKEEEKNSKPATAAAAKNQNNNQTKA